MVSSRRIYLLDPKKLSPETIAVAFAKTSRSPKAFDEIADELSDENSANFHEKWVVGYGHSSVAEHAVLHIAIENISRLAIECLESNRLASYTEKSSRYQIWDESSYYLPEEIKNTRVEEIYIETCRMLFRNYKIAFDKVTEYLAHNNPKQKEESNRTYKNRIRTISADVCRYFLPTSALANVGFSINARALEHALCKMLSHPLGEVREIGEEIKKVSLSNVPTLVKYANPNKYLLNIEEETREISKTIVAKKCVKQAWCNCVDHDKDGEYKILAAMLFRFGDLSYQESYAYVCSLTEQEINNLTDLLLGKIDSHDIPIREMEYASITFDLILDQGAYFELKRHRMMSQTVQAFTPDLGFAVPRLISMAGFHDGFISSMDSALNAYRTISEIDPLIAQYILPNAFNRRVLFKMNLRTALHLINLRCAPNAHFGIRRPILKIAEEIRKRFPHFSNYFVGPTDETWQSVEETSFIRTF